MEYTSASASAVLTNKDLLRKILVCLRCPSCLLSAALTSKQWLRGASGASEQFIGLPDFCAHHSPRLGIYVSSAGISAGSEFIPLLQLQPDVLNQALADYGFGDMPGPSVWDCRNGVVLFEFGGGAFRSGDLAVRSLLPPNMGTVQELPQPALPPSLPSGFPHAVLLPADRGDDAVCYHVNVSTWELENTVMVLVFVFRSSSWAVHCLATACLARSPVKILPATVLVGGKIYMATQAGYILGVDPAKKELFIVDLPDGAEGAQYTGNLLHCRGDDSVLYLLHVDGEDRLNVWLRRMDGGDDHGHGGGGGGANGWVLMDTISVRETCGHLLEQGWETVTDGDEYTPAVMVVGAGDNAEFVFLELGMTGVVVYMHLRTREVKQVYQREPDDDYYITVRPSLFIRPLVFPVLQDAHEGEAAAAQHQE